MKKKDINELIKGFDKLNLHFQTPKYTDQKIEEIEKRVNCTLPSDFKKTLLAGYIDKGTFYFLPIYRLEEDQKFLVFGKWNDNTFAFDTEAKTKDFPVYVTTNHGKPEKCFDNFLLNTLTNNISTG